MSVVSCAINGIYSIICRDPDTAAGGLDPFDTPDHSDGFIRYDRFDIDTLEGTAIDRKVEVLFNGTTSWGTFSNGATGAQNRFMSITIRVGYFCGDKEAETRVVAAEDERIIARALSDQTNWPTCTSGCIVDLSATSSEFNTLYGQRGVLEIAVTAQVYG